MPNNVVDIIFNAVDNVSSKADQIAETVQAMGTIFGSMVGTAKIITQEMEQLAKAVEKTPELFSEEELRIAKNYLEVSKDVSKTWEHIGLKIMPIVAADMEAIATITDRGGQSLADWAAGIINGAKGIASELDIAAESASSFDRAIMNQTGTHIKLRAEITQDTAALKEMSGTYKTIISNMFAIQSAGESFASGEEDRASRIKELEQEKVRISLQQNEALAEGNLSLERRNSFALRQIKIDEQLAEITLQGTNAIEEQEKARKKMVFGMLEQKAMADGIISTPEFEWLQNTAVGLGLIDRASADASIAASDLATSMWENEFALSSVIDPMEKTRDLMAQIRALGGVVDFGVNFQTFGAPVGAASTNTLLAAGGGRTRRTLDMNWLAQETTRLQTP